MKKIPLTQEKHALVDNEDFGLVSQYKWHAEKQGKVWYAFRSMRHNGKRVRQALHRFIMKVQYGDKRLVDHINHNGLDNRRNNLRVCTKQQNAFNMHKLNKGVCFASKKRKWVAYIHKNGAFNFLGYFDCKNKAIQKRHQVEKQFFGEFANACCAQT